MDYHVLRPLSENVYSIRKAHPSASSNSVHALIRVVYGRIVSSVVAYRYWHNGDDAYWNSSCLSVRPHGTARLPRDGFSLNLTSFEHFSKICPENSSFNKIRYDKLNGTLRECRYNFWSCLSHFFLEWEIFQTKVVEIIKTHLLCSVTFFFFSSKIVPF
jgi:hypothetical protein